MMSLLKKIVRPSIRKKLILSFVCILIIPALVIGGFSFNAAKKEVENEMLTSAKTNAEVFNSIIDDTLNSTLKDTTYFANEITQKLIKGEESPDIRKTFSQYNVLHPNLVSIYIGSVNGLMIQEPKKDLPDDYDPRQRSWFQEALKKKGEVIITDPYVAASTGDMVVTLAMQLSDGSGVVGIDLNLRTLSELSNRTKIGNEGYTFLLDKKKKYIVHPTEKVGSAATQKFFDNMYKKSSGEFSYVFKGAHKKMIFTTNSLTGWKIGGTMYSSEVDDAARPIYISMIFIIVASIIIGGVVVYFIIRSITNPLKKLRNSAKKISSGDLTEKIEVRTNDEIGELSNTFNEMSDNLRQLIQQVDLGAEQVAASSEQLTASAEQTVGATEQVASANQAISNGVVTTTKGLENHATAMEEIAQGMERVTDSAALVTDLTQQTTKDAKAGGESVQQSVQQMKSINVSVNESNTIIKSLHERSREIGSITDVISGISDQTNLLALNAAIEAARAGEHGKGFAVVADEIRKLAEQSSLSTKKITELIQGIQIDTENSVKVMEKASEDVESGLVLSEDMSKKFANILQGVTNIGPQMEEVAAISQQISASVQEVTSTAAELTKIARTNAEQTNEMSATTEEQVASMEEIAASAKSLSQLAEDLQELVKKFKI